MHALARSPFTLLKTKFREGSLHKFPLPPPPRLLQFQCVCAFTQKRIPLPPLPSSFHKNAFSCHLFRANKIRRPLRILHHERASNGRTSAKGAVGNPRSSLAGSRPPFRTRQKGFARQNARNGGLRRETRFKKFMVYKKYRT